MDSKRSYLDSLNAGRTRRPQTTLDQLSLSLEQLERQLDLRSGQRADQDIYRPSRQRLADETAPYYDRMTPPAQARQSWETGRGGQQGAARNEAAKLADELQALRDEMQVMLSDTHPPRRMPAAQAHGGSEAAEIRAEIERLTDAVQTLTQRADDRPFNVLRLELEQARAAIDSLAREDTVRAMSDRWEDFERRMTAQDGMDQHYALLAERIDRMNAALSDLPDALPLRSLEERMRNLTGAVEHFASQSDAPRGKSLAAIEARLDEISRAIAVSLNTPAQADPGPLQRIEARIAALSSQIETGRDSKNSLFGIETRLDQLAARLEKPAKPTPAVDPLLVSNLEAQIASLSSYLARSDQSVAAGSGLEPRLERLERSVDDNRDMVFAAATEAAETAVKRMSGRSANADAAAGLADDLRQLESLTRRSDERNAKTFEAIHDTLLKIVDRLGSLEHTERVSAEPVRRKFDLPSTPSIAPEGELSPVEAQVATASADTQPVLTPAQAAAAAAVAALNEEAPARNSMFGSLARKLGRKTPAEQPQALPVEPAFQEEAPSVDLDQPLDPKAVNRPLEPGSGAPDLNAIMRRVRDERAGPARQAEPDVAKSDFIAAARRAAQAAAAEAEVLKTSSDKAGANKSKIGDAMKARRKPILMAAVAVMIALAGLQLSKSFVNDPADLTKQGKADASAPTAEPKTIDERKADELPPARIAEPAKASEAVTPVATDQQAALPQEAGPDIPLEAAGTSPSAATPADTPSEASEAATTPAVESPAAPAGATKIEVPVDAGPIPLREAAAAGDSKALFEIGARYADGRGVKSDMAEAARWYEKSAELGFAPAQYRIGNFYEKGTGVARDIAKAKTWYQLAANQGNASAMHNLAVLFAMGADGTADNDSAVRWFTQAADLGVKDSQFNLGILAAKGVGMPQSLEASYKWFAIVAKSGDRDAAAKRDEIARSLRPELLEKARSAADLWQPKDLNVEANTADIPEIWQESPSQTASVDMTKAIRNVQAILNKNGYDAGGADGMMGERTKQAIMEFQKDNGLAANGVVDRALVEALLAKK
jgi:localization factor PodJL